jgi:hypothetical protein
VTSSRGPNDVDGSHGRYLSLCGARAGRGRTQRIRPAPDRQRQRVLSEDEIRPVGRALDHEHPRLFRHQSAHGTARRRGSRRELRRAEPGDQLMDNSGFAEQNGLNHCRRIPARVRAGWQKSQQSAAVAPSSAHSQRLPQHNGQVEVGISEYPQHGTAHQPRTEGGRADRRALERRVQGGMTSGAAASHMVAPCAAPSRVEVSEARRDGCHCPLRATPISRSARH